MSGKTAYIAVAKKCDFCDKSANYDFKTSWGPWANGCDDHYLQHRAYEKLGTGKGQLLVVGEEPEKSKSEVRADIMAALDAGDMDAAMDAVGDGDILDFL
jgi:hypothetical protein